MSTSQELPTVEGLFEDLLSELADMISEGRQADAQRLIENFGNVMLSAVPTWRGNKFGYVPTITDVIDNNTEAAKAFNPAYFDVNNMVPAAASSPLTQGDDQPKDIVEGEHASESKQEDNPHDLELQSEVTPEVESATAETPPEKAVEEDPLDDNSAKLEPQ